jgi:hypothetical protein
MIHALEWKRFAGGFVFYYLDTDENAAASLCLKLAQVISAK